MTYYGRKGTPYSLGQRLGGGGEGEVFSINGKSNLVAKLYFENKKFVPTANNPNPHQLLREKIETMLDQPVNAYIQGVLSIAWPQDSLYDQNGKFVGFTMPRVDSKHHIFTACRERERVVLYPKYTWKTAIVIAFNLSLAVNEVHRSGAVIGDMNPNNIMVDSHGHVTLIDTDSFNIRNKRTGKLYKCSVGVPECLPPELQGKYLADNANQFTKETDSFALSIHIFNLLMNNCHPFGCSGMNQNHPSSSNNPIASNIVRGNCPYVSNGKGSTSPSAPDIAMLPHSIRSLFDRSFSYDVYTAVKPETINKRPSADEWQRALYHLYSQEPLATCHRNAHHVYPKHYGKCPWCTSVALTPPHQPATPPALSVNRTRRKLRTLWLVNTLVGAFLTPLLGSIFISQFASQTDIANYKMIISVALHLLGAGAGCFMSFWIHKKYLSSSHTLPWLLLALLTPLLAIVSVGATILGVGFSLAASYLAIAVFIIYCIYQFFN